MAKSSSPARNGNSLVIVESPAKARTISRFLGSQYTIEASIGHIRDLPQGAKEMPTHLKGEAWSYLGVNVDKEFEPVYVIPKEKAQQVRKLKQAMKDAENVYLATDEDREGEAISWHLCEVLRPKVPIHRLVFHEITEEAILESLRNPRQIDQDLVRAQEVRRIVDRLYGYDVSPLLWRKIRPKLSAGRVQSVAVRLIVERERQRMRFRSATYWDLLGTFASQGNERFQAALVSVDGRRVPASRDFDPATGGLKDETLLCLDGEAAQQLLARLERAEFKVASVEDKPYTTDPYPPFTTSTLQQEANRKYGFTARHTMQVAQSLYENGHITYMRTDSTNLASVAVQAARDLILTQYGKDYLPDKPRVYAGKVKNAQEAHEAIRPAGHPFDLPDGLRGKLNPDEFRLYDLIWKRTIASQMTNARGHRVTIAVGGDGALFQVSGRTIEFPGYLRAYVEGSDDPDARLADQEDVLPKVTVGQPLECRQLEPKSHTTQPPNRFSEASLTRELERLGIGRPSTYASIIDTILARQYVFKIRRGNVLVPTWTAFAVCQLMEKHLAELVDYQFTAEMEDELDAISRGEMSHVKYLKEFYFGDEHIGLKQLLAQKVDEIDAREVSRVPLGKAADGQDVNVRVGRYGPFVEYGDRRASVPDQTPPDELTLEKALELIEKSAVGDEPLGTCPETGKPVFLKTGRFGPYVQRGTSEDEEKPRNASLLKGMEPDDVNLEVALRLLSLPRIVGVHPENSMEVVAHNGRYGPYVKCGEETRSLPEDVSPLDVTLEQAVELLSQPKGRRKSAARRGPLRVLDASPVTGNPVQVLEGRYGPYVTDGETNASLPRGADPAEITLDFAVQLLKDRAERGPTRKPARAKKAGAKKAGGAGAPVKKKAAKKKTTKKKASKKAKTAKKTTGD